MGYNHPAKLYFSLSYESKLCAISIDRLKTINKKLLSIDLWLLTACRRLKSQSFFFILKAQSAALQAPRS
jgi:hypothetical protein